MKIITHSNQQSSGKSLLFIALIVLAAICGLFWIDQETKQFSDLLTKGNLAALALDYVPTFLSPVSFLSF